MIIDFHVHTQCQDARSETEHIHEMRRLAAHSAVGRVVHLFNLGSGRDPSPDDIRASNDVGMRLVAGDPGFFTSFCYLNPSHDPEFSLGEIDRCVVRGNMSGIKLWISVRAEDARLDPIMERAAQLKIPVLHHAWYKMTKYEFNESDPPAIAHLASRHPDVTIVMAHLAGVRWRGVLDVKGCPNVVVDTSGGQPDAGLVEFAVAQLGPERVVFGSDWPLRDFAVQKARVTGSRISPEEKAMILGGNAARILGLEGGASHA